MKKLLYIISVFILSGSFYSCQDTLGIDEYQKTLIAGDSIFNIIQDTIYKDVLHTDTVFVDTTIVDTVVVNDTLWKEVYHTYFELSMIDGYIKNSNTSKIYSLKNFISYKNIADVTYTVENRNVTLFFDFDMDNIETDFTKSYYGRDELITKVKFKLDGLDVENRNVVSLNGDINSNKYAYLEVLDSDLKYKNYTGEECNFLISIEPQIPKDNKGNILSATIAFRAIVETKSVFYDWLVLYGVLFIQF